MAERFAVEAGVPIFYLEGEKPRKSMSFCCPKSWPGIRRIISSQEIRSYTTDPRTRKWRWTAEPCLLKTAVLER
jgi:hypothetical protein